MDESQSVQPVPVLSSSDMKLRMKLLMYYRVKQKVEENILLFNL